MAKTIICGECGEEQKTLKDCVEHYMAGCSDIEVCTLDEAIDCVTDEIAGLQGQQVAFSHMLREWWNCQGSTHLTTHEFANGIAFCFLELGFEVDDTEGD